MPAALQEMTSGHTCGHMLALLYLVSGDNAFLILNPDLDLILTLKPSLSISFSLWADKRFRKVDFIYSQCTN